MRLTGWFIVETCKMTNIQNKQKKKKISTFGPPKVCSTCRLRCTTVQKSPKIRNPGNSYVTFALIGADYLKIF